MRNRTASLNHDTSWKSVPLVKRLCLAAPAIFGGMGFFSAARYVRNPVEAVVSQADRVSGAIGLAVAVTALYWLFAWEPGNSRKALRTILTLAMLATTAFAFYVGLPYI